MNFLWATPHRCCCVKHGKLLCVGLCDKIQLYTLMSVYFCCSTHLMHIKLLTFSLGIVASLCAFYQFEYNILTWEYAGKYECRA